MIGNEVTPIYYDKAVCLRDSGFVQQLHPVDPLKRRFSLLLRSADLRRYVIILPNTKKPDNACKKKYQTVKSVKL